MCRRETSREGIPYGSLPLLNQQALFVAKIASVNQCRADALPPRPHVSAGMAA